MSHDRTSRRGAPRRTARLRALAPAATLAAALAAALSTAPARAGDPAEAERLFIEGRDALKRGDQGTACARFRSSLALARVANTLFNVAQCDERAGRLATSLQRWREGVLLLPPGDERLAVAKERLGSLEARVPKITFTTAPDFPKDARVLVDGAPTTLPASGTSMPFDPGEHVIVVDAPGRLPRRFDVTLAERDRKEVALAPGPASAKPGPTVTAPPPPPPAFDVRRPLAFAAGGLGLAGLAVFGVTGGVLVARDAQIRDACPDRLCTPAGRALIDGNAPLMVANAVALGVGIAGLGAGAVLLLASGRDREATPAAPAAPGAPAAAAAPSAAALPVFLPGGGGAALVGRF